MLAKSCILTDFTGHYRSGAVCGKGSFATVCSVYDALDPHEQKYAMKSIVKESVLKSKSRRQAVLLEIDILRNIKNPFVIRLVRVHDSTTHIHLIMDFLEGGELFSRINRRNGYTEKHARIAMRNIFCALEYMHE